MISRRARRVRALVFTGTGSAFSAGMDLGELRTILDQLRIDDSGKVWEGALRGEALIERVYRLGKPSIAAVNGIAVGNGAGFLSACDLAVAADNARIGYTEMKHGIQAGMVILHLMRLVGERVARYLLLTGELVTADQAKVLGLINKVVPPGQLMDAALTMHTAPQSITAITVRVAIALARCVSSAAPTLVCSMWVSD